MNESTTFPWQYQVISHLHSECMEPAELQETLKQLQATAPVLILAGDIGNLLDEMTETNLRLVLDHCSRHWRCIIYVLGNHEYYLPKNRRVPWKTPCMMSLAEAEEVYSGLVSNWPNITLLTTGQFIMYQGVGILGGTLWTDVSGMSANSWAKIHDSRYAKRGEISSRYQYEAEYLVKELAHRRSLGQTLMVITHFPPTSRSAVTSGPRGIGAYFNGDLLDQLGDQQLPLVWIHGHDHYKSVRRVRNCHLVCCPWTQEQN